MSKTLPAEPERAAEPGRQRSEILFEAGRHVRLRVAADLTPGGLLGIAALVSSILLSTAVVVSAAGTAAARQRRSTG